MTMSTKRILSLVLALVMVLGTFGTVFAAPTASDKLAFLLENGVLKEGKADQDLKRRDSVVLLSRLMKEEAAAAVHPATDKYDDIEDPFYNGYIGWATEKGYVNGKENKKFDPNGPLTAQAFATMLLRALGYQENGKDLFDEAYAIGKDYGIFEDVVVGEKEVVTRGDMAAMTYNALGVKMNGQDKTLAEVLGIKMPVVEAPEATELKVEGVYADNLKEVVLQLSNAKLADLDRLENVNNYKVIRADNTVLEVAKVDVVGNDVVVLLANEDNNSFLQNREYTLRVRSIHNDINGERKFVAKDNALPKVEEVVVLGKKGIKLVVSEPINVLDNVRGRTFVIDGKNIAMNVESYGRNVILTPYYNENFPAGASKLEITGLADFAGFKTEKEVHDIEMVEDTEEPVLVDLILRGTRTVEAVFDKDVYKGTVGAYYDRNDVGNISYESGRHIVYAADAEKIDTNKVLYTFTDEFLRVRTDFTLVDVENHSGVKMVKTTMLAREILDNAEPEIIRNSIISQDAKGNVTLRLFFDKDVVGTLNTEGVRSSGFDMERHFNLYDKDVSTRGLLTGDNAGRANYFVGAEYAFADRNDVIDVKLQNLTEWQTENDYYYILEVENFVDSLGRNRMFREYVDFKHTLATGFELTRIEAPIYRNNEVELTLVFNKYVDRLTAEDPTNYIFERTLPSGSVERKDVKELGGRIVTERNGTNVTLIVPHEEFVKYDASTANGRLRVLDTLKSTANLRLARVYVYDILNRNLLAANADYTITRNEDIYTVTASAPLTDLNLSSTNTGTYVIEVDVTGTLTVNLPNAHLVINSNVNELVVDAISANSIQIGTSGELKNLVVNTEKEFRVLGKVNGLSVISKVDKPKVNVVRVSGGKEVVTTLKLEKNKAVTLTVKDNGEIETENVVLEVSVTGVTYDKNTVTVKFDVKDNKGKEVTNIKESDVKVFKALSNDREELKVIKDEKSFKNLENGEYSILVEGTKGEDYEVFVQVKGTDSEVSTDRVTIK